MSLAGMDWKAFEKAGGIPKPEAREKTKARKDRGEAAVKKAVRAACERRDGHCLAKRAGAKDACAGRSTWAHLAGNRRSQTRGMSPEQRHSTAHTAMLCVHHHAQEESGQARVVYLSKKGADGQVRWKAAA